MLDKKIVDSYFLKAQNTRVIIRQMTCTEGFCLIVDNDWSVSSYLRKALSYRNMDSKCADTNEDAIFVLRRNQKDIICALVNIDLVNQRVVEEIEDTNIPYVAYSRSEKIRKEYKRKYPHMNVMSDISKIALIDSLGVV